jgi:hypothetical protein
MERTLYAAGSDPAVAEAVRRTIEQDHSPLDLGYALRGEAGFHIAEIEYLRKEGPESLAELLSDGKPVSNQATLPFAKDPKAYDRFLDANGLVLLRLNWKAVDAVKLPYPESAHALAKLETDMENTAKSGNVTYMLEVIMSPMISNLTFRPTFTRAWVDIDRSAASVLMWKAQHGTFPRTLAEAVTPVPTDPFDGKPLRYRQEGNGFVIYSVGATGKFDGGTPNKKLDVKEALFRYPLPAYVP